MIGDPTKDSILTALRRLHCMLKSPRVVRIAWGAAIIIFFGGVAISVAARPELILSFQLESLLVVGLLFSPAMTLINMIITKETAALAGVAMSNTASLRLAVMSAAANHLPVPGGPLLRTAAIHAGGAGLKDAGLSNIVSGIAWMSATFIFVSVCAVFLDATLALALGMLGAILGAAMLGVARSLPFRRAVLVRLCLISSISAAVYAGAIYTALNAFGGNLSFPVAAVIAAAGVIGAASSIAPSGLGVREAAAAGLATLIGVDAAAAFTATAIVHIAMAGFTGVCALFFFVQSKSKTAAA